MEKSGEELLRGRRTDRERKADQTLARRHRRHRVEQRNNKRGGQQNRHAGRGSCRLRHNADGAVAVIDAARVMMHDE